MSDNLDKPMTRKDFALLMPVILGEAVIACTSSLLSHLTTEQRLVELANRLHDFGSGLTADVDGREMFIEIASQLMASEPGG